MTFNKYKPRSIDQQKDTMGNETPVSAITLNVADVAAHVISRALARAYHLGLRLTSFTSSTYKTRARPIGVGGPRYDGRDPARDQNRVYLPSFNYYSATLVSRSRSHAGYKIAPFVASPLPPRHSRHLPPTSPSQ